MAFYNTPYKVRTGIITDVRARSLSYNNG